MAPKTKGSSIRFDRSNINCFQFLFLIAKQTPIPDTKNNKGNIQIKIDADISNMYANLVEVTRVGNRDVYVLSLDGDITGDVSLFGQFDVAELSGDFGGNAYIDADTLAIKDFIFLFSAIYPFLLSLFCW